MNLRSQSKRCCPSSTIIGKAPQVGLALKHLLAATPYREELLSADESLRKIVHQSARTRGRLSESLKQPYTYEGLAGDRTPSYNEFKTTCNCRDMFWCMFKKVTAHASQALKEICLVAAAQSATLVEDMLKSEKAFRYSRIKARGPRFGDEQHRGRSALTSNTVESCFSNMADRQEFEGRQLEKYSNQVSIEASHQPSNCKANKTSQKMSTV